LDRAEDQSSAVAFFLTRGKEGAAGYDPQLREAVELVLAQLMQHPASKIDGSPARNY
jgi:hypothetical protein